MPEPEEQERIDVRIEGQKWTGLEDLSITRSIDAFAVFGFTAPFEPERDIFRKTFQPFTFKTIEVFVDDVRLFWGTMVNVDPETKADERRVRVSAYSFPHVLVDCCEPASAWPLELNGLKLGEIAEKLIQPFGLELVFDGEQGAAFRRVRIEPDATIYDFLVEIAKQRAMVISDTEDGQLLMWRSVEGGQPVVRLREGEQGLLEVVPRYSPQAYFTEVTGLAKTRVGRAGAGYTVENPRLQGGENVRPHTFRLSDTDPADVPKATWGKIGRMFGNALSVEIAVPTWRTPSGNLFRPNTTIKLTAPGAMIYRESEFLIRSVKLEKSGRSQVARLTLCLPGAFDEKIPEFMPWEDPN